MAEFTPITTQEEFEAAISGRLDRQKTTLESQFAAERKTLTDKVAEQDQTISTLQQSIEDSAQKYSDQDAQLQNLQAENAGLKTAAIKERVAREAGLPYEFAARLSGDTEEALRADAETLAKFVAKKGPGTPIAYVDDSADGKDPTQAAMRKMLKSLNTGE